MLELTALEIFCITLCETSFSVSITYIQRDYNFLYYYVALYRVVCLYLRLDVKLATYGIVNLRQKLSFCRNIPQN